MPPISPARFPVMPSRSCRPPPPSRPRSTAPARRRTCRAPARFPPSFRRSRCPRMVISTMRSAPIVATAGPSTGEVVYCIIATGRSNAAVSGGKVLYSSVASTQPGWDGHVNRTAFVNGQTDLTGVDCRRLLLGDRRGTGDLLELRFHADRIRLCLGQALSGDARHGHQHGSVTPARSRSVPDASCFAGTARTCRPSRHERLQAMRAKFSTSPLDADDDLTLDPAALDRPRTPRRSRKRFSACMMKSPAATRAIAWPAGPESSDGVGSYRRGRLMRRRKLDADRRRPAVTAQAGNARRDP